MSNFKEHGFLPRDESFLAFNERVLDWAKRKDVPLLERLRYLCIVSSNLDEFFEVRMALHLRAVHHHDNKAHYSSHSFIKLSELAHHLVDEQYALYNEELLPDFSSKGIRLLSHGERNLAQKKWVKQYFDHEVKPLLVPVGLDPAHPFPTVANKSLNFIVRLSGADAFGRENEIAIVKVPRVLPRIIKVPEKNVGKKNYFVALSSVIRAHLNDLFPGRHVGQFSQFRVTRDSELAVDEEDVQNLRTALRQGLEQRQFGQAVRLEVSSGCSQDLYNFLLKQFQLPMSALYRVHGPVNLVRLNQMIDLVDEPALLFKPYKPSFPRAYISSESIFKQLKKKDILIHQPFESFSAVLAFLREAVNDPDVLAIKQTIYRTGSDSELMDLLREAVRRGKEVTAVVELKARFDEEANINWSERLESIGAQVVYGVVGLKTHAKMLLVTRKEGRKLVRYAHLCTGNYNSRTAKLYTDISMLTADHKVTSDVEQVFIHLAGQSPLPKLHHLLVAPFHLHDQLIGFVNAVAASALHGQRGRIVLKMNSLTDERLAKSLMDASQAGVLIDVIVRGACILSAQVPDQTDNIKVRSIVGRFLEHSRVFYFSSGESEHLYLSSADWMNRNMLRRVEIAWPVLDPHLRQRLIDECLLAYLGDTEDAWSLKANGKYEKTSLDQEKITHSAQQALMRRYEAKK
ncbi:MAG: polyphosphate kinase 1 [Betaproteobacteria bacterium]